MTQNKKSNAKLIHNLKKKIHLSYSPHKFILLHFWKCFFIQSSSFSSFVYNIVIIINTPTTINNQFQAVNAFKINIYTFIFLFLFLTHKPIPFTSSLISSKISTFFISKFISLLKLFKFMILGQDWVDNFHYKVIWHEPHQI